MDRFEEALAACRRSLAIEPTSGAYSNAGSSEFFLGRYGEASKDFEKAVALTPDRYDGWADLADAYYWSGRKSEAHEAYQKAIRMARSELQVNPRDPSAHARLAVCLARTGELSEARAETSRAVELAARDPRVLYDAAIVSKMSGHKDEALVWLGRAVAAGSGLLQIRREPEFAGLQKEPRFEEELRKAPRK
jgi:serine/threonine-protein kinase